MTQFLLILTILIWPFGQLLNISLPGLIQVIYPLDVAVGLLALSLCFSRNSRQTILRDPLIRPLLFFLLAAGLSLLVNPNSLRSEGLAYPLFYLLRLTIYPSVYFAIKLSPPKVISKYILTSLLAFSVLGISQYLFFPDMRFLKYLGFDDHYYRLIGSFYDPNFTGAVLAGAAIIFLSLGNWLISLPLLILLALTFSRASYLVFLLGLVFLVIARKKWSLLVFTFLLGGIIYLVPKPFGEGINLFRTFSIFSRMESWQIGLNLFSQKPLFGLGYNTLRSISGERFQIDNSFIYIAATTGLVGLIAFINLLKEVLRLTTLLPQKLFIFALLIHSLFNNSLFYIWIYFVFWLISGLQITRYKES